MLLPNFLVVCNLTSYELQAVIYYSFYEMVLNFKQECKAPSSYFFNYKTIFIFNKILPSCVYSN